MNQTVDERIVEMRIDNDQFERAAERTMATLGRLRKSTDFTDTEQSVERLGSKIGGFVEKVGSGVTGLIRVLGDLIVLPAKAVNSILSISQSVADGFANAIGTVRDLVSRIPLIGTAVEQVGSVTESLYEKVKDWAMKRIVENSIDALLGKLGQLKNMATSFSIGQISPGFEKFGDKTRSVATLLAQGYELEKVNDLMDELNWFTDETSYNFVDMVGNIAKFTATGQDLDDSVTAMEGIALWAALSGQGAAKASMAMYQLAQAMTKGKLATDDFKSIQNASMDTKEFRQQAVAAAEALGTLEKAGDGVWQTLGGKQFTFNELFTSKGLTEQGWLSSEVMMSVFGRYAKSVKEIQRYVSEREDVSTAAEALDELEEAAKSLSEETGIELDEAFQKLGYDIDQFSIKAFKAGQQARSWGDVVDSVKDAVSTGWMKTFELIFGTAEAATAFWSDLAERFYDIFAEGGNIRNKILAIGFGTGEAAKTTGQSTEDGWSRFKKQIENSGHTMEDFENVCREVIDATGELKLDQLVDEYGGLKEVFQQGAISGEQFKKILDELSMSTELSSEATVENAGNAAESLEELKEVARGILRGDYGNGSDRKKMLEELGYNYELVQGLADIMHNNGQGTVDITEELLSREYPTFYAMLEEYSRSANDAMEESDAILNDIQTNIVDVSGTTGEVIDRIKGTDLFKGALQNLLDIIGQIQEASRNAKEAIFGDAETRGKRIYRFLEGFNRFTEGLLLSESKVSGLQNILTNIYAVAFNLGHLFQPLGSLLYSLSQAFVSFNKGLVKTLFNESTVKTSAAFTKAVGNFLYSLNSFVRSSLPYLEISGERIASVIKTFGRGLTDLATIAISTSRAFLNGLFGSDAIQNGFTEISGIAGKLPEILRKVNSGAQNLISLAVANLPKIQDFAYRVGQSIQFISGQVLESLPVIRQLFGKTVVSITDKIAEIFPSFQSTATQIRNWFTERIGEINKDGEQLIPAWSEIFQKLRNIASETSDGLGELFGEKGLGQIFSSVGSAIGWIVDTLKDLLTTKPSESLKTTLSSLGKFSAGGNFNFKISDLFGKREDLEQTEGILSRIFGFFSKKVDPEDAINADSGGPAFDMNNLLPTPNEATTVAEKLWERIKNAFSGTYQKIDWKQMFQLWKSGIYAYWLINVSTFFRNLTKSLNPKTNGLIGATAALKGVFVKIGGVFGSFSKKIEREGRANEIIKLSVAVGILALAMMGLALIPEQTLFNVAAVMAGLMLLLKGLAGIGKGISIFSNNVKSIKGNEEVKTVNEFFKNVDLSFKDIKDKLATITLTGNVIPPAMGALIGVAALVASIGHLFIKIKDLKDVREVTGALTVIGIILGTIGGLVLLTGWLGPRMKGTGSVFLGIGVMFLAITKAFTMINQAKWTAGGVIAALGAAVTACFLVSILGTSIDKAFASDPFKTTGKILAFSVAISALGGLVLSIALSIGLISLLDPGSVLAAGVALLFTIGALAAFVYAFSKVPKEASMVKAAASMMLLAIAVGMLAVPLVALAAVIKRFELEDSILLAAGGMLAVVTFLSIALAGLSAVPSKTSLVKTASAMVLASRVFIAIARAFSILDTINFDNLGSSAMALLGALGILSLALGLLAAVPSETEMLKTAGAMTIASLVFIAIAGAFAILDRVNFNNLESSSMAFLGAFGILVLALGLLSAVPSETEMLKTAGAMAIASLVFIAIAGAFAILDTINFDYILAAGVALVSLFGILALALGLLSGILKDDTSNLFIVSSSLVIASVGIIAIAGALAILGDIDPISLGAATVCILGLITVMTLLTLALTRLKPERLIPAAGGMVLMALALDVLALGLAGLAYGFVQVVQNTEWDAFGKKLAAFKESMEPITPVLKMVGIALVAFVAIGMFAGKNIGKLGLGFAGLGVGVLALVYAFTLLPEAMQGIVDAMDVLNNNVGKIVEFVILVFGIIIAAMLAHKKKLATTTIKLLTACATALSDVKTLAILGKALKSLLSWGFVFLSGNIPGFTEKAILLIVNFFTALAVAVNNNATNIAKAVEKVIVAVINVILQTFNRLFFDALGFLVDTVAKPIGAAIKKIGELFGWDKGKEIGESLLSDAGSFFGIGDEMADQLNAWLQNNSDIVMDKIDDAAEDIEGAVSKDIADIFDAAQKEYDAQMGANSFDLREGFKYYGGDLASASNEDIATYLNMIFPDMSDGLKTRVETIFSTVGDEINEGYEDVNEQIEIGGEQLKATAVESVDEVFEAAQKKVDKLMGDQAFDVKDNFVSNGGDLTDLDAVNAEIETALKYAEENAQEPAKETGAGIVESIIDGAKAKFQEVVGEGDFASTVGDLMGDANILGEGFGTDVLGALDGVFNGEETPDIVSMMANAWSGAEAEVPDGAESYVTLTAEEVRKASEQYEEDFKKIGAYALSTVKDGYYDALTTESPQMANTTVSKLNDAYTAVYTEIVAIGANLFSWIKEGYDAQSENDASPLAEGAIAAIEAAFNEKRKRVFAIGTSVFGQLRDGYKFAADQHSPSRVMEEEMGYTIDGLVVGAKKEQHRAFTAMEGIGDGMMRAMHNSMGILALAVDRNYDLQPRITPVVDLGPAAAGARTLNGMLNGGTISQVLDRYDSMASLNISGDTLNYTNQNGPVASAIHDLSARMDKLGTALDEDRNFNVGIRVDSMAVRDDQDIERISEALAKKIRVSLRQRGKA